MALALLVTASGCAPDSVTNAPATGYNAYLNTIASNCNLLMPGVDCRRAACGVRQRSL